MLIAAPLLYCSKRGGRHFEGVNSGHGPTTEAMFVRKYPPASLVPPDGRAKLSAELREVFERLISDTSQREDPCEMSLGAKASEAGTKASSEASYEAGSTPPDAGCSAVGPGQ